MVDNFAQGEKMSKSNLDYNLVDSVLIVKASGQVNDSAIMDLLLPQGKSIAQLIDDQQKKDTEKTVE
jgi:hypothetical protein